VERCEEGVTAPQEEGSGADGGSTRCPTPPLGVLFLSVLLTTLIRSYCFAVRQDERQVPPPLAVISDEDCSTSYHQKVPGRDPNQGELRT
jgi:hypothetical protein